MCICYFISATALLLSQLPMINKGECIAEILQPRDFQNYLQTILREQQTVQMLIGADLFCSVVRISLVLVPADNNRI